MTFRPACGKETAIEGQTVEQVWFAGVHADVGGWYDERGLSNLTLHWMLGKAADCDLRVNRDKLAQYQPNPQDLAHESYDGFWKLRGQKTRLIPPRARIHRSVFERMESSANDYSPPNLPEEYDTVG